MLKKRDELFFSPFRSLLDLNREMGRFMDRFGDGESMPGGFRPDVDIIEKNGQLVVTADLPGMEEKDIEVTINDGILAVRGERTEEKEETEKGFHRRERVFGRFVRQFALPKGTDAENVKAVFKNGVLEVRIPLKSVIEEKKIQIESK
ncbi:Hsp20/alpha crystallin family protein [Geovibrio ferrireducens]|uniref:Hsp20/alpha crystallin family protein n=1 Tax=Geovibrio ferrireducens TaxID=46201 RepID=UPI002248596C|nr:Hsp20/alpha crystallin family protein [Geovibrio ferrireducens]